MAQNAGQAHLLSNKMAGAMSVAPATILAQQLTKGKNKWQETEKR
jgi:hypothetical protein